MTVSRSPENSSERQFWRSQALKLDISEVIYDPQQSLQMNNKG